jgi:hypothetical protein
VQPRRLPDPVAAPPGDVLPGLTVPPPRARARHAIRQRARGRLLFAALVLVPLGTAGVMVGTHDPFSRSAGTGSHSPAPAPAASHSMTPAASHSPVPVMSPPPHSSLADVPGVPASFAACVAFMASGDGTASRNIYGITPASGYNVAGYSVPRQKAVFAALYKRYGAGLWTDGCV